MNKVYLSRRNLETLLRKLDDPSSFKAIKKNDSEHSIFASGETLVVAVEDYEDYYTDREQ